MPHRGRLTVAIVSTEAQWHGGEEQARLLADGLRQRGHRVAIFARRGGALAQRMAGEGHAVFHFGGSGRNPAALWHIRRGLRQLRPDVLHANDAHALSAAGLASLGLAVPGRVASRRVVFPIRLAIRYRTFCERLICVSRRVGEVCLQCGIPSRLIRVVHDGVDPERIASGDRARGRRALGVSDADRVLLTVAKLTEAKGHRFLLEAMPEVLARHPEVRLFLVGDGELADKLRARAEQMAIDAAVRFLGYRHDVPDLIRGADLFVFPSEMEGMGSTLVDAMLAGVPIVTTTAGGIPEVTGAREPGGPTAWMVPPCDPQALAAAIVQALRSPEQCAMLAQRARRRAERLFTAARMVEATLEVYRGVLASRTR
jgi:glycosyltransferase involved in cell wall biosynthesis